MAPRVKPRLLIGCVGDRFMPGVKESIMDATEAFKRVGEAEMVIQPPITVLPYFGLATMRNRICMKAVEDKFDYLLLLDNDVTIGFSVPQLLMEQSLAIVTPRLLQNYKRHVKLSEPEFTERDSGINLIQWQVFSCIMFSRPFLTNMVEPFLDTLCYNEEETTFQRWRLRHWKAYQATDVGVCLLRPPTNLWEMKRDDLLRIQTPGDIEVSKIT